MHSNWSFSGAAVQENLKDQNAQQLNFQTEAATRGVLYKKQFFKILQYSPKDTCVGVSF